MNSNICLNIQVTNFTSRWNLWPCHTTDAKLFMKLWNRQTFLTVFMYDHIHISLKPMVSKHTINNKQVRFEALHNCQRCLKNCDVICFCLYVAGDLYFNFNAAPSRYISKQTKLVKNMESIWKLWNLSILLYFCTDTVNNYGGYINFEKMHQYGI